MKAKVEKKINLSTKSKSSKLKKKINLIKKPAVKLTTKSVKAVTTGTSVLKKPKDVLKKAVKVEKVTKKTEPKKENLKEEKPKVKKIPVEKGQNAKKPLQKSVHLEGSKKPSQKSVQLEGSKKKTTLKSEKNKILKPEVSKDIKKEQKSVVEESSPKGKATVKKENKKLKQLNKKSKPNKTKNAVVSAQLDKRIENQKLRKKEPKPERGVIYLRNLPHGFYEDQIKAYFEQFGFVTRVRVLRSPRTGKPRCRAFVEFDIPEVAEAAAETLRSSLMFQKIVKATYIPPDEQNQDYFKSSVTKVVNPAGKTIYVSAITKRIHKHISKANKWNETTSVKRMDRLKSKLEGKQKRFEHLGVNFSDVVLK